MEDLELKHSKNYSILNLESDLTSQVEKAKSFVERKESLSHRQFKDINPNDYKTKGIVYFIYVIDGKTNEKKLKYIGKSDGNLFSNRMSNHFIIQTKGTHSKRARIEEEEKKGNIVELNFITTNPKSLRNTIEEELISIFKKQLLWNGKGNPENL